MDKFQSGIIQEDAEEVVFVELHREYYPTGELHFIGGISKGKRQGLLREFSKEGDVISSYIYQNDTLLAKGMTDSSSLLEGDWIYYYPNGKVQAEGKYKKTPIKIVPEKEHTVKTDGGRKLNKKWYQNLYISSQLTQTEEKDRAIE